jgi:hypothetical protein
MESDEGTSAGWERGLKYVHLPHGLTFEQHHAG